MIRRILSKLLWLANSDPPMARTRFYAMKDALLHRWGTRDGWDMQRIIKDCWGCMEYDENGDEVRGCQGPGCCKCGGTGIWETKYIHLERWKLGGRVFHSNPQRVQKRDAIAVTIEGRIQHAHVGRAADEAVLWLSLLTGHWRLFWSEAANTYRYGRRYWPLVNAVCLLWFAARLWDRVKVNRCHCGRTWRHWFDSTGWCVCRECRKTQEEIPF